MFYGLSGDHSVQLYALNTLIKFQPMNKLFIHIKQSYILVNVEKQVIDASNLSELFLPGVSKLSFQLDCLQSARNVTFSLVFLVSFLVFFSPVSIPFFCLVLFCVYHPPKLKRMKLLLELRQDALLL